MTATDAFDPCDWTVLMEPVISCVLLRKYALIKVKICTAPR